MTSLQRIKRVNLNKDGRIKIVASSNNMSSQTTKWWSHSTSTNSALSPNKNSRIKSHSLHSSTKILRWVQFLKVSKRSIWMCVDLILFLRIIHSIMWWNLQPIRVLTNQNWFHSLRRGRDLFQITTRGLLWSDQLSCLAKGAVKAETLFEKFA